jgi:hypothetical protein
LCLYSPGFFTRCTEEEKEAAKQKYRSKNHGVSDKAMMNQEENSHSANFKKLIDSQKKVDNLISIADKRRICSQK